MEPGSSADAKDPEAGKKLGPWGNSRPARLQPERNGERWENTARGEDRGQIRRDHEGLWKKFEFYSKHNEKP